MSSDRANAKKLAVMLILVIVLLLVGSSIVEAAKFTEKVKDFGKMFKADGKIGKQFTGKQITNIILITALLIIAQIIFWKIGDSTSKYAIWIIFFIIAIMSATHIVPEADHFVWQEQPIVKTRILAFGCYGMEEDLKLSSIAGRYQNCKDDGSYTLNSRGKQGVLKTGTNGAGLPAFFFALISLFIVASVYGKYIGLENQKYLKYFLVIYLAIMITNEGFEKSTLVMIGGWITVIAIYSKIKENLKNTPQPPVNEYENSLGETKTKLWSKSSLSMGLSFAFVQVICNLFRGSLLGDNIWNPPDLTGGWILFYLFVGVMISYVGKPLLASVQTRINKRMTTMDKKAQADVQKLANENHPWLALGRDIPGIGFIISKLKQVKKIIGNEKDFETKLKEKTDELRKLILQPRTPENEQKINDIKNALLEIKKLDARIDAEEYKPWLYDQYSR